MKGSKVQVREELAEAGENLQYGLVDLDFGGLVQTATECQTCSCTALISTFSRQAGKEGKEQIDSQRPQAAEQWANDVDQCQSNPDGN